MVPTAQLRTLFLTNKSPYPPVSGAAFRNWQNISCLQQHGEVGVFSLQPQTETTAKSSDAIPDLTHWYVHAAQQPPPQSKLIRQLRMLGWLLTKIDPLTDNFYSPAAAALLDHILATFHPNLVVFEELWMYCYLFIVRRYPCQIIYDAHNIETDLHHQMFATEKQPETLANKLEAALRLKLIEVIERNLIQNADQVWTCSEQDAQLLQTLNTPLPKIVVIPNGININYYSTVRLGQQTLPDKLEASLHTIIFTASFSYAPNVVAAELLLNEIYPRLKNEFPDCRLLLVGADPTKSMLADAQKYADVVITGRVPSIHAYLAAASVVVVPLLQGGGTRLKILEAFAAGRPVVSTTKGAEGLAAIDGVHLLVRDGVEAFVQAVGTLWRNPSLQQTLVANALKLAQESYSWEAIGLRIDQAVSTFSKPIQNPPPLPLDTAI